MENLISKELFFEIKKYKDFDFSFIYNVVTEKLEKGSESVYFICKEWALSQGYILESLTNRSCIIGNNFEYFATVKIHKETSSTIAHNINENTEIEAIINACQWILDNKESK